MNSTNPYAPPKAEVADHVEVTTDALAGRWQRLGAAILDALIGVIWSLPLSYTFGLYDTYIHGHRPPMGVAILSTLLGFMAFALVNGYFLQRTGQTLGKKLVGIRIATLDNGVPRLEKTLGVRYPVIMLAGLIPLIGPLLSLIDVLLIFRSDRRCLHDLIAGTKVVRV